MLQQEEEERRKKKEERLLYKQKIRDEKQKILEEERRKVEEEANLKKQKVSLLSLPFLLFPLLHTFCFYSLPLPYSLLFPSLASPPSFPLLLLFTSGRKCSLFICCQFQMISYFDELSPPVLFLSPRSFNTHRAACFLLPFPLPFPSRSLSTCSKMKKLTERNWGNCKNNNNNGIIIRKRKRKSNK